jgi:hypothetical protein
MLGNVLCVLETRDGALRKVSHEVVAAGRRIGAKVDALVLASGPVSGDLPSADRILTRPTPISRATIRMASPRRSRSTPVPMTRSCSPRPRRGRILRLALVRSWAYRLRRMSPTWGRWREGDCDASGITQARPFRRCGSTASLRWSRCGRTHSWRTGRRRPGSSHRRGPIVHPTCQSE